MKRSKTKPSRFLMGMNIYIDELLILLLTYFEWNPIWNRVHSSWLKYSSFYISNLLSTPTNNFSLFPNLCNLTIHCTKPNQVPNETINIKNHIKINYIEIIGKKDGYHNIVLISLPKLSFLKLQNAKVNLFSVKECEKLKKLSMEKCKFIHFNSLPDIIEVYERDCYFNQSPVFPNLKILETDNLGRFSTTNMKLDVFKTKWFFYNDIIFTELHLTEDYQINSFYTHVYLQVTTLFITKKSTHVYENPNTKIAIIFPNLKKLVLIGFYEIKEVWGFSPQVEIIYS